MGIFSKKQTGRDSEDFDSQVRATELQPEQEPQQEPQAEALVGQRMATQDMTQRTPPPAVDSSAEQEYGIEQAIALMRTLPTENVELVVKVVKQTLESTNIDIPTIIVDATQKQERISKTIAQLLVEITELDVEVSNRENEIEVLETDRDETALVKERLELAVSLASDPSPEDVNVSEDEDEDENASHSSGNSKAADESMGSDRAKRPSASPQC